MSKSLDAHESRIEARLERWREQNREPLFIGMGGGSASGKTTLAQAIVERLAPLRVEVIHQDPFFKPAEELPTYYAASEGASNPDYNRPDSFRTEEMFAHCRKAAGSGEADVILFEGILALYYPELRALMDIKIYVTCPSDERIIRRLLRGRPPWPVEKMVHYYLDCVRPEHERYNAPTARHADLIVPGGRDEHASREQALTALCEPIGRAFGSRRGETGDESPAKS